MSLPPPNARPARLVAAQCTECLTPLAPGQRYCVECGARRGALPYQVVTALKTPAATGPISVEPPQTTDDDLLHWADTIQIPAAWQAATAILGLLAFGVVAGSLGGPGGAYASGARQIAYVQQAAPAAPAAAPAVVASTPAADDTSVTNTSSADTISTPAVADTSSGSSSGSSDDAAATTPTATTPTSTNGLPPIKHVFLIMLSDHTGDDAFGASSASSYLSTTLKAQGELLSNYYGVAQSPLANGIAMISGQGPTPETAANCPTPTDLTPAAPGDNGQLLGTGCVYPASLRTIGDQLSQDGETWKSYNQDMGTGPADEKTCRHPALGAADDAAAPTTGDGYVSWRNPFGYFHSVTDPASCAKTDVGLDQLVPDLADAATTPSFSYIVPNRCNDGSPDPCAPGETGGLASTDTFLRIVVPEIQNSAAYKDGGLIAITFDGAPQTGDGADTSSCCDTPAYPNLPTTPATTPATTPTDGSADTTPDPTTPTTPTATTPGLGDAATTTGGGKVGMLLLSDYVKAGSTNVTSSYNHYSFLATVENLFSLDKLGYAAVPTLPTFDISVFNGKSY